MELRYLFFYENSDNFLLESFYDIFNLYILLWISKINSLTINVHIGMDRSHMQIDNTITFNQVYTFKYLNLL